MQLTTIREQFEHSLRLLGARETELRAGADEIERLAHQLGAAAAESSRLGAELEDEALLRGAHHTLHLMAPYLATAQRRHLLSLSSAYAHVDQAMAA